MKKNLILSIIIITKNRSRLLELAVKSLVSTKNIQQDYEVVVVDNNSTDRTKIAISKSIKNISNLNYVLELSPGVSTAKNTGIKHAKGKYVAFLDDDSVADKSWVDNIIKHIKTFPKHKIFGGPYFRYSTVKIPSWLPSKFGILDNGDKGRQLNRGTEWLSATNLIVKRDIFSKIGSFNERLNMTTKKRVYGEETEFQLRAIRKNIKIYYDPSVKVSHLLNPKKLKINWILKDAFIRGEGTYNLSQKYTDIFRKKRLSNKKSLFNKNDNILQNMVIFLQYVFFALGKIYGHISNEKI